MNFEMNVQLNLASNPYSILRNQVTVQWTHGERSLRDRFPTERVSHLARYAKGATVCCTKKAWHCSRQDYLLFNLGLASAGRRAFRQRATLPNTRKNHALYGSISVNYSERGVAWDVHVSLVWKGGIMGGHQGQGRCVPFVLMDSE